MLMWEATFKDGSKLSQYHMGKEVLFREVLDRESELKTFALLSVDANSSCSVDLEDGSFVIVKGGQQLRVPVKCGDSEVGEFRKLVYYLRCQHLFAGCIHSGSKESVVYGVIGWELFIGSERHSKYCVKYDGDTFELLVE